jgi:hypothetical protein
MTLIGGSDLQRTQLPFPVRGKNSLEGGTMLRKQLSSCYYGAIGTPACRLEGLIAAMVQSHFG